MGSHGGDPIAERFDSLVARFGPRAHAVIRGILGDADAAQDAWQETWFAVWRALPGLDPDAPAWPYVRRTAVRKAVDGLRARRRGADLPLVSEPASPAARSNLPVSSLDGLGREERAVLVLYFWEGLAVAEIAATLEVPVGTVKTWMHRARRRLREIIEREEGHRDL